MSVNKFSLREVIAEKLDEMCRHDDRIVVVNADLMKSSRLMGFVEHHPNQSFNLGIAEQNMVSFAAGLAHEGYIPYVFSMAPFLSMRACEQCRIDVAYANVNVRLVGSYSGVSGGISGATHWGLEDIGVMTSIPDMTVVEVSDAIQCEAMLEETLHYDGPLYFRVTVEPVKDLYRTEERFQIGRASIVRDGDEGAFICSGITVKYAVDAADEISDEIGVEIRVVDMHTIKPIDRNAVISAAKTGIMITAQDHNIYGGLGQQVGMVIAEERLKCRFQNIGIPDRFDAMAHAPYLYSKYGYDKEGLKERMIEMLKKRTECQSKGEGHSHHL